MARPQARPPLAEYARRERQSLSRRAYSAIGATSPPCRHLATGRRTRAAHPRGRSRSFREFGPEMPLPRVGGALGSGASPRRAKLARPTCDLCPSYSPQILPYPGSPGTASGEPRQVCSISDKFIPPERRSSAVRRPRTGRGTGQVWILHGAAVYLRAHGAFRGAPEACRLRGAAIARRRRLCCSLSHRRHGLSVCAVRPLRRP